MYSVRIPANKEALGDCGVWVKKESPEDITMSLNALYNHYNEFEWQGSANLERVKSNFSWRSKAAQYDDFIKNIMA